MNKPWFRRVAGFSYIPVSWEGWAATCVMMALAAPLAALSMILSDEHPVVGWIAGAAFITVAASYFAVVMWRLERTYGS
jgi:hypothetical protein